MGYGDYSLGFEWIMDSSPGFFIRKPFSPVFSPGRESGRMARRPERLDYGVVFRSVLDI